MKKRVIKQSIASFIVATQLLGLMPISVMGMEAVVSEKDYAISNPYATVNWAEYGQYKADFHAHSVESDGSNTPAAMIEDHYAKNFDILAMTDHNFLSTTWDRTDRTTTYLTTARLAEITAGTDRNNRGMTALLESDEQSLSDHVNTFFAPFNNVSGATLESSIAKAQELGGISHMNHPGRYTGGSNTSGTVGEEASNNPTTVKKYVDLFEKYSSCVGMEIINKKDGDSYSDRILWDNILEETMPSRPVWGFSNDDTHSTAATGYSYNMMLMPSNTVANVRTSMENGTFYAVALVAKRELGSSFVASGLAPQITNIVVDQTEDRITITGANYTSVEWIANGLVIATGETIDLDQYSSQITTYVRAQLKGTGGIGFTQPFGTTASEAPVVEKELEEIALFDGGSIWKYMDDASNQGTAWKTSVFDDATWKSGKGALGYPVTDTNSVFGPVSSGTLVNKLSNPNAIITYYFRKEFTIDNLEAIKKLTGVMGLDDGYVLYVNGVEVRRLYMPTGEITYLTNATLVNEASSATGIDQADLTDVMLPLLKEGKNTIAVEVHNRDNTSSDIYWDMKLIATVEKAVDTKPVVKLTAKDEVSISEKSSQVEFTVAMSKMNKLNALDYSFSFDTTVLKFNRATLVSPDNAVIQASVKGNQVRVIVGFTTPITAADNSEVMHLVFDRVDDSSKSIETTLHIDRATSSQSGVYEEVISTIEANDPTVVLTSYKVLCDVNGDHEISIIDLSIALDYYRAMATDSSWNKAKAADVNRDGLIDMTDYTLIMMNIM